MRIRHQNVICSTLEYVHKPKIDLFVVVGLIRFFFALFFYFFSHLLLLLAFAGYETSS